MYTEQLEQLDAKAESLLANRLRNFARGGLPPERVLRLAVQPEIDIPVEAHASAPETASAA
jgi:hypothetical protein